MRTEAMFAGHSEFMDIRPDLASFRGASKTPTRNLEIPGLVLRTIPE
jgi:hypothetical protein